MRRIDLGVFESAEATPDGGLDGAGHRGGNEIGDLVSFATFLGPELHRHGGAERAAGVIKAWADDDAAILGEAETVAYRAHHKEAAEILHRARELATA